MSASMKMAKARTRGYGGGYAGDPGLFGFIGKAVKSVVGAGLGIAKSLPGIGPVVTGASGFLGSMLGRGRVAPAEAPYRPANVPQVFLGNPAARLQIERAMGMPQGGQRLPVPGSKGTVPSMVGEGITHAPPDLSGRWKPNKTGYYVQAIDGQPEMGGIWVPPQSAWVRKRRRNSLNPRALDRAISRVSSAKKASKKLGRITIREACS